MLNFKNEKIFWHFFQQKTSEPLKCPLKAEGPGDKFKPYTTFVANVSEFRRLDQFPVPLKFGPDVDVDELVRMKPNGIKPAT